MGAIKDAFEGFLLHLKVCVTTSSLGPHLLPPILPPFPPGLPQLQMFDIGKRERRPTQSNLNEGALLKRMAVDGKIGNRGKHMKLPKQLRLPRIDDVWTFYDRERLRELQKV